MEGAFNHLGNHLLSDSAAAIKAGADDFTGIEPDESFLYGKFGGRGARRRADDDDNQTELYDDDDNDSLTSMPVGAMKDLSLGRPQDEDRELPPHACAYVLPSLAQV
ncbi:hypothetical protein LZ32DRAFT_225025 [Colletotrichum eremochloae]|nr:hypothetical protein LZ32DRAFT_225025 [Colletotrichum eremochloae]